MAHNNQNGKVNGINNKAFVNDENVVSQLGVENESKNYKKKPAPQPPAQSSAISDNEIPPEITKLDEILEAAANSIDNSVIERKLSADTVSNVSDFVSHEENVVAVVHRDNVVTPANSNAPSFSSDKKDSIPNGNEYFNPDDKIDEKLVENEYEIPSDIIVPPAENEYEIPSDIIVTNEVQKEAPIENEYIKVLEDSPSPEPEEQPPIENDNVKDSDTESIKEDPTKRASEASLIPTPPPSPTSPILKPKRRESNNMPAPPPLITPMLSMGEVKSIVRPTTSSLRSVTLKPTKQKEEVKQEDRYEPGEENLKVGSDKYKHFLQNLNGKLQNINFVPSFIPYAKKTYDKPAPKEESEDRKPNENVVEDSINKLDAMEKLGSFITNPSRNKGILGNINNVLNEKPITDDERKSSNDEINNDNGTNFTADPEEEDKMSTSTDRTSDSDFMEHKNRMQNVFRSMKMDAGKDSEFDRSRFVKSLGPSALGDDKSRHRQAMGEIFKSIKLRRRQEDGD